MRIRVRHFKLGELVFLSQLDMVNTILHALRRARIPFALSEGFSPKPKISYGLPLPVGAGSLAEYFDLILEKRIDPEKARKMLDKQVPDLLGIRSVWEISGEEPALQAAVSAAEYYIWQKVSGSDIDNFVNNFLDQEKWDYVDSKGRKKDLKELMFNFDYLGIRQGLAGFKVTAAAGSKKNFRPADFCDLIRKNSEGKIQAPGRILRCELFSGGENEPLTPFSGG